MTSYNKYFVLLFFTTLILVEGNISAQSRSDISALQVGDPVPEAFWHQSLSVANHPEGIDTITMNQYRDKLVILDFWETWCKVCVESLPKMDSLSTEFKQGLRIILVSTRGSDIAEPFLTNRNSGLMSIVDGKLVSDYFPHRFVPHEVWIKDGRVFAITNHLAVTDDNIRDVLSGKLTSLAEMKTNRDYDLTQPLLLRGNGGQASDIRYRSLITGYLDGIGGGGVITDSLGRFKLRALNGSIVQLYQGAIRISGDHRLAYKNRCVIEFDTTAVLPLTNVPAYTPGEREKYYCYELIVPSTLKNEVSKLMLDDLNRFFGAIYNIQGVIEKRTVNCWALIKKDSTALLVSQYESPKIIYDIPGEIEYQKQPFEKFYAAVASIYRKEPWPMIDCTGITGYIDITFPTDVKEISSFRPYLNKYGLDIRQEKLEVEMLVIKEISK